LQRHVRGGRWAIIMLVVPFIGLLMYTLLRPSEAEIARRSPR
jgi:hypothetical protein